MSIDVTEADALEQLERILMSPDFEGSARTKAFLEHLVARELEGRGDELRGTALAMDVFGRGVDFDPNVDPIVRIEAVKLRKALDHYYLTSGSIDPVIIKIPKGQYRPAFEPNTVSRNSGEQLTQPESVWPVLGIRAFSGSDTPRAAVFRDGFPEELGLELARFGHIRVITGYPDEKEDGMMISQAPECDYVLDGIVRDGEKGLRLIVQLKRTRDRSLVWSDRRDIPLDSTDVFEVQENISRQCAAKLADAYGVISTDASETYSGRRPSGTSTYEALLSFHAHLRTSRSGSLKKMMKLAKAATQENGADGLAHALVALGYVEEVAQGRKRLASILQDGQLHAEKAVALDPLCPEALLAAAVYAQFAGDRPKFERLIVAATGANPNSALLIALAAAWVALVFDAKRGEQMMRQALRINPMLPNWTNITLCLKDVENGDYRSASERVRLMDARDTASDWLLIAAIHGRAGETELAQYALSKFPCENFTLEEYLDDLPYASGVVEMLREETGKL